jgi:hypothetical protein
MHSDTQRFFRLLLKEQNIPLIASWRNGLSTLKLICLHRGETFFNAEKSLKCRRIFSNFLFWNPPIYYRIHKLSPRITALILMYPTHAALHFSSTSTKIVSYQLCLSILRSVFRSGFYYYILYLSFLPTCYSRFRWPRSLKHRSAAAWLLRSRVWILLGAWMFVSCVYMLCCPV